VGGQTKLSCGKTETCTTWPCNHTDNSQSLHNLSSDQLPSQLHNQSPTPSTSCATAISRSVDAATVSQEYNDTMDTCKVFTLKARPHWRHVAFNM